MTVNTPKDPIDGVTEWTNEETGIKYRYIGGAWRAVSSKAAQDVADALGQMDLQKVLDNGNVADKGAEFGGTVKVKAEDTTADGDPLFAIEGDQANDGTGDNLLVARRHSNQGDQVRYYGPVVNNKEVTTKEYVDEIDDLQTAAISELQGSVLVLQQEIEQLSQLQDTGKWVYNGNGATPRQGQFTLSTNQGIPATTWADAVKIIVDETDVGMGNHTFDSWEEDDTIEIFNTATNTYALYTLGAPAQTGFALKDLQRSRSLPINNAEYEIRVFKLESGINLETADERYVQKTGDQMSGVLETTRPIWIRPGTGAAKGVNNMLVVNQVNPGPGGGSIARFQQDGKDVIKVQVDKVTSFEDNRVEKVGDPTQDKDAANKEYVDTKVKKAGDTMTGHLKVTNPNKTDGTYLFSVDAEGLADGKKVAFRVTADGKVKAGHDTTNPFIATANNDVITKKALDDAIAAMPAPGSGIYLPLAGGTMTGTLNMGNQWISNVKTPTASHEATNRQYVDGKVNERLKMIDTAYPILWQYKQGASASALQDGEFTINDKGGTTHVVDIYFAERDAYGRKLWASNNDNAYSHELGNQMMSIRDYMDICYQGKTMKWYMGETNGTSHLYTSYGKFNYALNNNKVYMIYIPGVMPAYRFPGSWYNGQGKVPTAFELPEEKDEPLNTYYGPGEDSGPFEVNGYYPLYNLEYDANAAGDGTSHSHEFDGVTYYMPNGVTYYHGNYNSSY